MLGCGDVATEEGEQAAGGSGESGNGNGSGNGSGVDEDEDDGVWATIDGSPTDWAPADGGSATHVDMADWEYQVFVGAGAPLLLVIDLAEAPGELDCGQNEDGFADVNITLESNGDATIHTAHDEGGGSCRVDVTTATGAGGRLEGTFSATLVADGQPDITVTDGRFALAVQP